MNCNTVRKYFYAFLDNELDVEKNIEVLSHLDMCYECSRKIEKERLIQRRVKETVCTVNAPPYLKQEILRCAERRPRFFTLFIKDFLLKSKLALISGIAAVIVLSVCFFIVQNKLNKNDFLRLAESKYHDYVMKRLDPDIRLQDSKSILEHFQKETSLSTILPGIQESLELQNMKAIVEYFQKQANLPITLPYIKGNAQLVGASFFEMNGIKLPMVFYNCNGTPITIGIICNSNFNFSKMKEILMDKMVIHTYTGFCGTCQIIGWKGVDSQYIMISTLPQEKMLGMLTKV